MRIYLAGPINGCTDDECNDWRTSVKQRFADTLDPMRRDYRGIEADSYREIVDLDKLDVTACDVLLAVCPKPSAGTSMEVLLAWQMGKVVVVVAPDPISPWLRYHSTRTFGRLGDAINWLETLDDSLPRDPGRR
ncbi:nucleoside 2-deoxyribosyltransferase [Stutzerimonas nitrititolerans]|uniref:nucleoside 2-deoxyribosyltransferase n=1 Tax=Stutzerimonas nitrititolerans TaxID=2482751 RepID=UPI0035E3C158